MATPNCNGSGNGYGRSLIWPLLSTTSDTSLPFFVAYIWSMRFVPAPSDPSHEEPAAAMDRIQACLHTRPIYRVRWRNPR